MGPVAGSVMDTFCITCNPLSSFRGATVYFMREEAEWMFLREMEGGRWKYTSVAENITNRLLEHTELTVIFGDIMEPMDRDCNFRAMLFRHLPPSLLQKEMLVHDTRSLNKVDISHEEYRELISILKKFDQRMTYMEDEPVNASTFMCVPVELNLAEKLVKNLFQASEEAIPVEKISVHGHVWVWLCIGGCGCVHMCMSVLVCVWCVSVCLPALPYVHPSVRPSVRPSICSFLCLSVSLSICLSAYLCVCLVCMCMHAYMHVSVFFYACICVYVCAY